NTAAYGASGTITLDTTAPSFTSLALANDAADGCVTTSEKALTKNLGGTLTGSGYDTAAYKLTTSATTCDNALTYSATMPKDNSTDFGSDGAYKICVKLTDNAGNTAAYGASGTITLDTTAPSFTSLALANDA